MRYLLFGVWLALLLAVGLAFVHEQSTLEGYRLIVGTMYGEILCHIDALQMLDMADSGYSVTWYGDYVYDDTPVNGVTFHRYYCKGPCVPLATTWTNAEGNWVDAETGKPLVPTQNVQVNNDVMIQVNQ